MIIIVDLRCRVAQFLLKLAGILSKGGWMGSYLVSFCRATPEGKVNEEKRPVIMRKRLVIEAIDYCGNMRINVNIRYNIRIYTIHTIYIIHTIRIIHKMHKMHILYIMYIIYTTYNIFIIYTIYIHSITQYTHCISSSI